MTTAFVSGITGQDGAYLAELLLGKSYRVLGGYRRSSSGTFWRLAELGLLDHPNLTLVETDVTDLGSIIRVLTKYKPREVYNLAAHTKSLKARPMGPSPCSDRHDEPGSLDEFVPAETAMVDDVFIVGEDTV